MRIWTCKTGLAALLAAGFALSGCTDTGAGFGEGGSLLTSRGGGLFGPPNNALPSVGMMRGALFLQPPNGYCIDRRSYRQNFALVARCDTLGAQTGTQSEPLGIMTVSILPMPDGIDPASLEAMAVPPQAKVLDRYVSGDLKLAYVSGGSDVPGAAREHWRSVVKVDDFLVGFAAYRPSDRPALTAVDRTTLVRLINQSRAATASAGQTQGVVTKKATDFASLGLFD